MDRRKGKRISYLLCVALCVLGCGCSGKTALTTDPATDVADASGSVVSVSDSNGKNDKIGSSNEDGVLNQYFPYVHNQKVSLAGRILDYDFVGMATLQFQNVMKGSKGELCNFGQAVL